MGRRRSGSARFNCADLSDVCEPEPRHSLFSPSQQRGRRTLELESQLSDARLQALRMQLHHTLVHTLNAISTLVHTNPDAADEMIGSSVICLRLSLIRDGTGGSVKQELKYFDCYLDIEQIRSESLT